MIKAQLDFLPVNQSTSRGLSEVRSKGEIADIMDEYRARIDGITEKLNGRTHESIYGVLYQQTGNDGQDEELEELITESRVRVQQEMSNLNDLENELYTELGRLYQVIAEAQEKLQHNESKLVEFIGVRNS